MNVYVLNTSEECAEKGLNRDLPWIGIEQQGIHGNLFEVDEKTKKSVFKKKEIKKLFNRFYKKVKHNDLIVVGTAQENTFNVHGIVRVCSEAYYTEEAPQHRRRAEIIWTGSSFSMEEWLFAKQLKKLKEEKQLRTFIDVYTNYLNIVGVEKRIIAQQSDKELIIYLGNDEAQLLDLHSNVLFESVNIHSITKTGYWDTYIGAQNAEELIKNISINLEVHNEEELSDVSNQEV